VVSVSERSGKLNQVAGARVAQNHAGVESLCLSLKTARDHDVQAFAGSRLAKDNLAGIEAYAL
jgi:hypothetical protein